VNIIHIASINPTLCVGFLIQSKLQYTEFIGWIKKIKGKHFIDYMEKEPRYSQIESKVMDFE